MMITLESVDVVSRVERSVRTLLLAAVALVLVCVHMSGALAMENGSVITFEVVSRGKNSIDKELTRRSVEVMRNRLQSVGISDGLVEQRGDRRIVIRLGGTGSEVDWIINALIRPSRLEFRLVNDDGSPNDPAVDEEVLFEAKRGGTAG